MWGKKPPANPYQSLFVIPIYLCSEHTIPMKYSQNDRHLAQAKAETSIFFTTQSYHTSLSKTSLCWYPVLEDFGLKARTPNKEESIQEYWEVLCYMESSVKWLKGLYIWKDLHNEALGNSHIVFLLSAVILISSYKTTNCICSCTSSLNMWISGCTGFWRTRLERKVIQNIGKLSRKTTCVVLGQLIFRCSPRAIYIFDNYMFQNGKFGRVVNTKTSNCVAPILNLSQFFLMETKS